MIVVFIIMIIYGIFVKQRKKNFDFLIILFFCLLQYHQQGAPDFASYESVYNTIGLGSRYLDTGHGWLFLCKFGNLLNLTYRQFQVLFLLVGLLLVKYVVNKIAGNNRKTTIYYSLYLLFPALLDLVQFRFFIAQVLVIFGISFLCENTKKNYLKFMVFVLVAYTVHSSSLFYLIFLLIPFFEKIEKFIIPLIVVISVALFGFKDKLIALISMFVNETRVNVYFLQMNSAGFFGVIAYVITLSVFYVVLSNASSICSKKLESKVQRTFVNNVYIMSVLSCIAFPLTSFNTNLFRVQRIMWPLLYLVLTIMLNNGIFKMKFLNYSISIKKVGIAVALFGFVFYILWFTSNVITAYLI